MVIKKPEPLEKAPAISGLTRGRPLFGRWERAEAAKPEDLFFYSLLSLCGTDSGCLAKGGLVKQISEIDIQTENPQQDAVTHDRN